MMKSWPKPNTVNVNTVFFSFGDILIGQKCCQFAIMAERRQRSYFFNLFFQFHGWNMYNIYKYIICISPKICFCTDCHRLILLIHKHETSIISIYKFLYFTGVISHFIFTPSWHLGPHFHSLSGHSGSLFPPVKCTQYHIPDVISQRCDSFSLFLSLWNTQIQKCTLYMHASMLIFFIYFCAEQTSHCCSLVSCVMMMKSTCCSQQTPPDVTDILPALFTCRVVIQSLNFCDKDWKEIQDSAVEPALYVTFCRRKLANVHNFLDTLCSLCIM